MNVLVWGRQASATRAREAGYEIAHSKADLFERSDVLCLLVNMAPQNRGIVTREDLARMKPTALFVNTASIPKSWQGAVNRSRAGKISMRAACRR